MLEVRRASKPASRCVVLVISGVALLVALYVARVPNDPPGFYIDESSIAYNAHLISQTGRDEHGVRFPLYFRAFGEYKNPTIVYLLALVFKVTGPSIFAARLVVALSGAAAAVLLGLLAWKLSQRFSVAAIVALSAALTPWLYESSRLVFEVSVYPLVTALFLLALYRAAAKQFWKASDGVFIAVTLALLTYTYSIGRPLGPLFAAGLLLFARKRTWRMIAATLAAYMVTLTPLIVFAFRHPGALTARLSGITYIGEGGSSASVIVEFVEHYLANLNPWTMLVTGESNPRDHIEGVGSLLLATFIVAAIGLFLVAKRLRLDPWWQFIVYALFVSIIPASLTVNEFPQLRLIVFPVLLQVLMVPTLTRLPDMSVRRWIGLPITRLWFMAIVAAMIVQGAYFQWLFHQRSPARWYIMDARFARKVLEPALALNQRPIYLFDPPGKSGYIQAMWHGAVRGIPPSDFVRLSRPADAPADVVVVSTEEDCANCHLLARSLNYIVYAVLPSAAQPNVAALPSEAFRADISLRQTPESLIARRPQKLRVSVRNTSSVSWPCVSDASGHHGVTVHARWLSLDGSVISDAGKTNLDYDLEPGDVNDVDLEVIPLDSAGDYILEIDLVQEPDRRFSNHGSTPLLVRIRVVPG